MEITSSEEFRKQNKILFSAKLVHPDSGSNVASPRLKDKDVVDLNNNGKVDVDIVHFPLIEKEYLKLKEPTLVQRYDIIKEFGLRNKTEVVTQDDIRDTNVKTIEIEDLILGPEIVQKDNMRPIRSLINETVIAKNPKWGFDLTKDEFIIYEPNP